MSSKWAIVHADLEFRKVLRDCLSALEDRLASPPDDELGLAALLSEWDCFNRFMRKIDEIQKSDDPASLLEPAYDEHGHAIANYYFVREGEYRAYYRLDLEAKLCTGAYAKTDGEDVPGFSVMLTSK